MLSCGRVGWWAFQEQRGPGPNTAGAGTDSPKAGPGAIGRAWGGWSELFGLFGASRTLNVHNFEQISKQNAM